jgi:hypothetical protein
MMGVLVSRCGSREKPVDSSVCRGKVDGRQAVVVVDGSSVRARESGLCESVQIW